MRPVFVDPSVPLLAVGGEHPWRAACREVLEAAAACEVRLHLSVEGGQEFLFHRLRQVGRQQAVQQFGLLDRLAGWHPVDVEILRQSAELVRQGHARGRDAVHAATAISAGFSSIVSCDPDFDGIPGLKRLDPPVQGLG